MRTGSTGNGGDGRCRLAVLLCLAAALAAAASEARAGEAVTAVVLPPHVVGEGGALVAKAETLADLLAERMGRDESINVVNRTELKRLLAERKLSTRPAGPVFSYDAMVRVTADFMRVRPQVTLAVFDLSMGNMVKSKTYPWQDEPAEEQLSDMGELCCSAIRLAAAGAEGKLRVRFLGLRRQYELARQAPLAERIDQGLKDALAASPDVVLIQHLEAATGAEESLLLFMGLSKLAGGRRFVPEADAAIELTIKEVAAAGKPFEQTPVEVSFRTTGPKWSKVTGTYGRADKLLRDLWEAISRQLEGVSEEAGAAALAAAADRRRQAQAELAKFPQFNRLKRSDHLREQHQAAATAAKLDPTWEEAAYVHLATTYRLAYGEAKALPAQRRAALWRRIFEQGLRYLRRFRGSLEHRTGAFDITMDAGERALATAGGPERHELADMSRQVVDMALSESFRDHRVQRLGDRILSTYERLLDGGVPVRRCQQWRDEAFARVHAMLEQGRKANALRPIGHSIGGLSLSEQTEHWYWSCYVPLRGAELTCAVDEERRQEARNIVEDVIGSVPENSRYWAAQEARRWTEKVKELNDPELLDKLNKWLTERRGPRKSFSFPRIRWPGTDQGLLKDPPVIYLQFSEHHVSPGLYSRYGLGIVGRRLYLMLDDKGKRAQLHLHLPDRAGTGYMLRHWRRRVGYLELDADGVPRQAAAPVQPQPKTRKPLFAHAGEALGGKLYVGTVESGLLIYDPAGGSWTTVGPEQGLPAWSVFALRALDDQTLLCQACELKGMHGKVGPIFLYDVVKKQVTLLRGSEGQMRYQCRLLGGLRNGTKIFVAVRNGFCPDVANPKCPFARWPHVKVKGWPSYSHQYERSPGIHEILTVKGRHFVLGGGLVRQIDLSGRTVREWWHTRSMPYAPYYGVPQRIDIPGPGRWFMGYSAWVSTDRHGKEAGRLIFSARPTERVDIGGDKLMTCYDVEKDTWYGPVIAKHAPPAASRVEVAPLVDAGSPLQLADAVVQAATKAECVWTSEQLAELTPEPAPGASDFDRAKLAFTLRRFDKAKELLGRVLAEHPENGEALILMGMVHGRHGLRQYETALKYFRRLAELKDPEMAIAGLYYQMLVYEQTGQWAKALELGQTMVSSLKKDYARSLGDFCRHVEYLNRQTAAKLRSKPKRR